MKTVGVALSALLVIALASSTGAAIWGVGASAGMDIPVVQDDQDPGPVFGLRSRIQLIPSVVLEPTVSFTSYSEADLGIAGVTNDLEGSSVNSYGLDLVLGNSPGAPGIKPMIFGGAAFYNVSRDGTGGFDQDATRLGFSGGLGLAFGISPKFDIDARGRFVVIPKEEAGSWKSATITGGFTVYFGN